MKGVFVSRSTIVMVKQEYIENSPIPWFTNPISSIPLSVQPGCQRGSSIITAGGDGIGCEQRLCPSSNAHPELVIQRKCEAAKVITTK